jgi:hypothetical protein
MTTIMNQFVVDVYHNDKLYTIQQVLDFIDKTAEKCPGEGKITEINDSAKKQVGQIMKSYGLSVHSIVKKTGSPAGKIMSQLVYEYSNEVIKNRKIKD